MPFPIVDFVIRVHVPNATDATNQIVASLPYDCKLVSVRARHRVASTSGTINIVKSASGTSVASGTTMLTATMSNAGTADTNVDGSLKTGIGDMTVPQGSSIGILFAGTLTNLLDLDITIVARQLKK